MKITIELSEEDLTRFDLSQFGLGSAATTHPSEGTTQAVTTQAVTAEEPVVVEPEGPTIQEAIDAATAAVAEGQTAAVKAALASVNAKRVSELAVEDVQAFLDALSI